MSVDSSGLDSLIYGVDIHSGDARGSSPSYALVKIDTGSDEVKRDVVTRRKLLRLIDKEEPDVVAVDNIYEIARDKKDLIHVLREFPVDSKLVQVTGAEKPEPLSRVASRFDVPYGHDPMAEAEACARLALKKVGYEVRAFTDASEVKVSRGRSTGSGGWSEDRYTRKIHGNVKRVTREIQDTLDSAGLDYERDVTEKYGGYANATFEIDAKPSLIPVSSRRQGDVRVEVNRIQGDGLEFESLVMNRDGVIVGVDPGTTMGVALVDLDGEVLGILSTRTADTGEVIEWIIERGRPILVASDVSSMPDAVEKKRRSFNAGGWSPETDLSVEFKKRITGDHEYLYDNDHERDALAAALKAYEEHSDQFRRIRSKTPHGVDEDDIIKRVLTEERTVESILEELREEPGDMGESHDEEQNQETEDKIKTRYLGKQVRRLRSRVEELEDELDTRDDEIESLERELSAERRSELRDIRMEREVRELSKKNRELKKKRARIKKRYDELRDKFERLKDLWRVEHSDFSDIDGAENYTVVKTVDKFTDAGLTEAQQELGLSDGDVILFRDASGAGENTARKLVDIEPRLVLKHGGMSDRALNILFDEMVPVGDADYLEMKMVDELAIARESDIQEVIERWNEKASERQRRRKEQMVDRLIDEYRLNRKDS